MCTCSCLFYMLESLLPATRFLELTNVTFDHDVLIRCKLCWFFFFLREWKITVQWNKICNLWTRECTYSYVNIVALRLTFHECFLFVCTYGVFGNRRNFLRYKVKCLHFSSPDEHMCIINNLYYLWVAFWQQWIFAGNCE